MFCKFATGTVHSTYIQSIMLVYLFILPIARVAEAAFVLRKSSVTTSLYGSRSFIFEYIRLTDV